MPDRHVSRTASLLAGLLSVFLFVEFSERENCAADPPPPRQPAGPLSPEQSLEAFQLHPGLRIELVATEPQVIDPVAIAFDEHGRMWVVEMRDYPNGPAEGEPPQSRIRVLDDKDGDGLYETSTLFADRLLFANGLQPWNGGVVVTFSGEVAFLKDTNGDGSADLRETWFTGFKEENPQLRANHPTLGLDNHVYIANGLRGGDVIARKPEWSENAQPVPISGMDFRFDPFRGTYEAVSGLGQFGLTFDDYGNRFVCSNRNPCRHIVFEDRYIKRNPYLAVESVMSDPSPAGEESKVYPLSQAWTTSTLHAGQFTAACGVTIYRGNALPEEFYGNSFTCEPTGNLVHRDVLTASGATFTARPGREGVEFLATADTWFRPVNLAHGPDGALYVIDMYRAVIEHPQFMPDELKNRPDLAYGKDRGRIYRIVADRKTSDSPVRIADAAGGELVRLLEHPNAWQRDTAARLLLERQDQSLRGELESLAVQGKNPAARIRALWLLQGLGSLSRDAVLRGLGDSHPRVREQAVLLAEPALAQDAELLQRVQSLAADKDARLRFQVALSLGAAPLAPASLDALATIARAGAADPWTRKAVASSIGDQPHILLARALSGGEAAEQSAELPALVEELGQLIGSRQQPAEIQSALHALCGTAAATNDQFQIRAAGVLGLGEGLGRRGQRLATHAAMLPEDVRRCLSEVYERAVAVAADSDSPVPLRQRSITVLRHTDYATAGQPLLQLAAEEPVQEVRLAAIDTLARFSAPELGGILLRNMAGQTPAVRRAILDAMLATEQRTGELLAAIEAGKLDVRELDQSRSTRLTRHRNPEIRQRAEKLLASSVAPDRQKVVDEYQPALTLKADPLRGRELFQKNCTTCHRIADMGVDVAPDIADSRVKTPAALLTDILDPNRAVDNNYFSYTIITLQGTVLTGIISAETASSITLRQPEGKTVTVLRQDIDEIQSNNVSLMPAGLEKSLDVQQMADLISFVKNWRYLDGNVPIPLGE